MTLVGIINEVTKEGTQTSAQLSLSAGEWVAVAGFVITTIGVIVAYCTAKRANKLARQAADEAKSANDHSANANKLAEMALGVALAQSETGTRGMICAAQQRSANACTVITDFVAGKTPSKFTKTEKRQLDTFNKAMEAAVEQELSVYDIACRQYLEGKVDKQSFKKDFLLEIRKLCETREEPYNALMQHETTSPFKSVWRVYKEWNDI